MKKFILYDFILFAFSGAGIKACKMLYDTDKINPAFLRFSYKYIIICFVLSIAYGLMFAVWRALKN